MGAKNKATETAPTDSKAKKVKKDDDDPVDDGKVESVGNFRVPPEMLVEWIREFDSIHKDRREFWFNETNKANSKKMLEVFLAHLLANSTLTRAAIVKHPNQSLSYKYLREKMTAAVEKTLDIVQSVRNSFVEDSDDADVLKERVVQELMSKDSAMPKISRLSWKKKKMMFSLVFKRQIISGCYNIIKFYSKIVQIICTSVTY